jgi:hypothetical protein
VKKLRDDSNNNRIPRGKYQSSRICGRIPLAPDLLIPVRIPLLPAGEPGLTWAIGASGRVKNQQDPKQINGEVKTEPDATREP